MTTISAKEEERTALYHKQQLRRRNSIQKIHSSSSYASPGFIIALSLGLMAAITFFAATLQATMVDAFVVKPLLKHHSSNTKIFLEDWVADMIDNELYRQDHHKEYEAAWMEKNKGAVLSRLSDSNKVNSNIGSYPSQMMGDDQVSFAEHKRDERMAFLKPDKYCADRCLATGNCDILEDFYELSAMDVLKFCEECVLNFDEDISDESSGCDVPEAFYEKEPPLRP